MIVLLTIVITIFLVLNLVSIICFIDDGCWIDDSLCNISKWFLGIEIALLILFVIILCSIGFSIKIVCAVTNGDYKGCTELKENNNE